MPKIGLNPGHGGNDPGAIGIGGIRETDLNRAVAEHVRHLLSQDLEVVWLEGPGETRKANQHKLDVVISVHHNSAGDPAARGVEIWHSILPNSYGRKLAATIETNFRTYTQLPSRGLKSQESTTRPRQDYHYFIRETIAPAVIVECGFISNKLDAAYCTDPNGQRDIALAIANGIRDYLGMPLQDELPANILPWTMDAVLAGIKKGILNNPDALTESEQKTLVWLHRLGLLD